MHLYKNLLLLLLALSGGGMLRAQQAAPVPSATLASATRGKLIVSPVFNEALTDEALKGYSLKCSTLTLPAGYSDSTAHRHDADLFGYVLKGTVRIELDGGGLEIYREGQMFHERRNILHKKLQNMDSQNPAEILIVYVIKEGRSQYTAQ